MPPLASCWDDVWPGLVGWCGHGTCVNASEDGQGVAYCACDPGWASGFVVNPEKSAARCTISLISLGVLWSVIFSPAALVAVLTARSMRLRSTRLDHLDGCASLWAYSNILLGRRSPDSQGHGTERMWLGLQAFEGR